MSTTSFADIHPNIIQKHILPRLAGPSLSAVAAVSSSLQSLSSDDNIWAYITRSTWPSITHPKVDDVISTFPAGHRSFFQDSYPSLITDVDVDVNLNHRNRRHSSWSTPKPNCSSCIPDYSSQTYPSELISAVDIRYKDDIVYSTVQFTDTAADFLWSETELRIELNENELPITGISRPIDLEVDELAGADQATLSHLKESVTLSWILIDPTRKRAGNLSSIKAVGARQAWMSSDTILQYVTVLPGSDPNELVQCKIEVVLEAGGREMPVGLHVREVTLKCEDLDCKYVSGGEFFVILQGALLKENNVRRKVVGDEERGKSRKEFKKMRKEKKEWVKKEEERREFAIKMNYIGILVSFCFSLYFLSLLLDY